MSRRPCHAVVVIEPSQGNDPAVLAAALKTLKKQLGDVDGIARLLKRRGSRLWEYQKPSERKRLKSARARTRQAKRNRKREQRELHRDPHGTHGKVVVRPQDV